jgi:hypothetical protein
MENRNEAIWTDVESLRQSRNVNVELLSPEQADQRMVDEFNYQPGYFTGGDDFFGYPDLTGVLFFRDIRHNQLQ